METKLWTLEDALPVARALEAFLLQHKCHCAIGGSVLHKGSSGKDLDLFVYSHGDDSPHVGHLLHLLEEHFKCPLVSALENKGCTRYAATSVCAIYVGTLADGRRIDVFFMAKVLV
jgi:hypothetical protein